MYWFSDWFRALKQHIEKSDQVILVGRGKDALDSRTYTKYMHAKRKLDSMDSVAQTFVPPVSNDYLHPSNEWKYTTIASMDVYDDNSHPVYSTIPYKKRPHAMLTSEDLEKRAPMWLRQGVNNVYFDHWMLLNPRPFTMTPFSTQLFDEGSFFHKHYEYLRDVIKHTEESQKTQTQHNIDELNVVVSRVEKQLFDYYEAKKEKEQMSFSRKLCIDAKSRVIDMFSRVEIQINNMPVRFTSGNLDLSTAFNAPFVIDEDAFYEELDVSYDLESIICLISQYEDSISQRFSRSSTTELRKGIRDLINRLKENIPVYLHGSGMVITHTRTETSAEQADVSRSFRDAHDPYHMLKYHFCVIYNRVLSKALDDMRSVRFVDHQLLTSFCSDVSQDVAFEKDQLDGGVYGINIVYSAISNNCMLEVSDDLLKHLTDQKTKERKSRLSTEEVKNRTEYKDTQTIENEYRERIKGIISKTIRTAVKTLQRRLNNYIEDIWKDYERPRMSINDNIQRQKRSFVDDFERHIGVFSRSHPPPPSIPMLEDALKEERFSFSCTTPLVCALGKPSELSVDTNYAPSSSPFLPPFNHFEWIIEPSYNVYRDICEMRYAGNGNTTTSVSFSELLGYVNLMAEFIGAVRATNWFRNEWSNSTSHVQRR